MATGNVAAPCCMSKHGALNPSEVAWTALKTATPPLCPAVALVYYFFDPHGMTDDPHLSTVITTTMVGWAGDRI